MKQPPVFDIADQLAYFDANCDRLFERMLQEIADDRPQIIADARRRLEMGWGLYGDAGWHWPTARLALERRQEYADGLNYLHMEEWQAPEPDLFLEFGFEPDPAFVAAINGTDSPDD